MAQDEAFVSALLEASQAALRTHEREKLEALRNAVLNMAVGEAPDSSLRSIYLRLIGDYTPWHLRLLRFFEAPSENFRAMAVGGQANAAEVGRVGILLEPCFPELRGRRPFYELIVAELQRDGLMMEGEQFELHLMLTAPGRSLEVITEMGRELLTFITAPSGLAR